MRPMSDYEITHRPATEAIDPPPDAGFVIGVVVLVNILGYLVF